MSLASGPGRPRLTTRRIAIIAAAVLALVVLGTGSIFTAGLLMPSSPKRSVTLRPTPTATPIPTPLPSPSPTPTATAAPTPTPVITPTTPPSVVRSLSCTIAISAGGPGSGGFLALPSGQFRADPSSRVSTPQGGFFGLTHVLALNRWVPVPRDWVTPDGRRYVYPEYGSGIRVVASDGSSWLVGTGLMAPTASGPRVSYSWRVISAESDGIYIAPGDQAFSGLYRLGYSGGSTQVAGDSYWQAVAGGYAYGTVTQWVPSGATNTLIRLDLRTGARSDYFSAPGFSSRIVGFAADGSPVVSEENAQEIRVVLVTGPNRAATILTGTPPSGPGSSGIWTNGALGDAHGVWLATNRGIYLYSSTAGAELASPINGQLASSCRG